MDNRRGKGFWVLIAVGILLNILFIVGQTVSLFDYEFAVSLGLQESEEEITRAGIAFAKGFAFGDTVFYIPIFLAGIIGLLKRKRWGIFSMVGALAVTVYWPLVNLYAILAGRDAMNIRPEKYTTYPIILSLVAIYALWGIWYLYKNQDRLVD